VKRHTKKQGAGLILLLLLSLFCRPSLDVSADRVDHSLYAELLKKCVKNGAVDYDGFKNEEPHGKI
jgi:hypothetical protein